MSHTPKCNPSSCTPHGAQAAHIRARHPVSTHKHWEAQALLSPSVQHVLGQHLKAPRQSPGCTGKHFAKQCMVP